MRAMGSEIDRLNSAMAGHYAMEKAIGAGGMAAVYLARDLKHDRKVAVKVLLPDVAAAIGGERFLAEIRVTAALQHPNILPLYDSGAADGVLYYVMPLIEGESLRDRLNREKQLPVDEALDIIRTVAGALGFAHARGVIHRDIKPENILIQDGQALVADFGIALAASHAGGSRLTEAGITLGTPLYMCPEQALGEANLDLRADVYAMGATLYEMLAGQPPFAAASAQGIISKILSEPAPFIRRERPSVPEHVEAAILVALEKLPADRFSSAHAFADALANPGFSTRRLASAQPAAVGKRSRLERLVVPSLGLAAISLALAAWLFATRSPAVTDQTLRYRLALPALEALTSRYASRVALSPDGTMLVYAGPSPQGVQLWLRRRDQLEATPIPGTVGAAAPFFSPDGKQIGFLNVGKTSLQAVSLSEGIATTLVASGVRRSGASWGRDGILYVDDKRGLVRLAPGASADDVEVLVPFDKVADPKWPQALPDGKGVIFTKSLAAGSREYEVAVLPAGSKEPRTLVRAIVALCDPNGMILYVNAAAQLMSARIDVSEARLVGTPEQLDQGVDVQFDAVDFAISGQGSYVFGTGSPGRESAEIVVTDRQGTARVLDADWKGDFQSIELSPDGLLLAVSKVDSGQKMDIWVKSVRGGAARRVTLDADRNLRAVWNADGRTLGYIRESNDVRQFYSKAADGSGDRTLVTPMPVNHALWSADGNWLILRTGRVDSLDIFAQATQGGDTTVIPLATAPNANEHSPTLSADGKRVAYVSNRTGVWEVYVRPFPNASAGVWQVSTGGGTEPRWAHNSRELFYKSGGQMMVAEIEPGPAFAIRTQRPLFSLDEYFNFAFHPQYAVAPDDQHLYMVRTRRSAAVFDLVVVEHGRRSAAAAR